MLRVMVVDEDPEREEMLKSGLQAAGYDVVAALAPAIDLPARVAELQPDVIIIDLNSPDRDTLEHIILISQNQPRPIVMFSADGDSEKIRQAVRAGVSAYTSSSRRCAPSSRARTPSSPTASSSRRRRES
jgi:response regulator NasT